MVGCIARATATSITVDPVEMEEVRWVSKAGEWLRTSRALSCTVRCGCTVSCACAVLHPGSS
jgi:NADH pyrophosphatase NudC (nudix superfamily)